MQLPPTILSVDKNRKSEKTSPPAKKASQKKKEGVDRNETNAPSQPKSPAPEEMEAQVDLEPEDVAAGDEESSSSDSEASDGQQEEETAPPTTTERPPKASKLPQVKKKRGLRPPRSLETTLFDRLETMYGPSIKRMLNVQYRYRVPFCYLSIHFLIGGGVA